MTKRNPIGIHKIVISETDPSGSGVGIYDRTVYAHKNGSHSIFFRGCWLPVTYTGGDDGEWTASYVHTDQLNIKRQKLAKSLRRRLKY